MGNSDVVTGPHGIDRRSMVRTTLERRGIAVAPSQDSSASDWLQERFVARARALFYARMMFLTLGLLVLAVPAWASYFGLRNLTAFGAYFAMLLYSVANYMVIGHARAGRIVSYITLCLDLSILVVLIAKPQVGGGLQSPLLATQLLFTMLFAILFPKPLAIIPPLLALPITTRLDQLLDRPPSATETLTLLWYLGLNVIVVYVIVYLDQREVASHREVVGLQADLKDLAVVEERNRLAREIHDGLGASLSALIIQSEYLLSLTKDDDLRAEILDLKASAEQSIEELRRSLRMMREDFDLVTGLEEYSRNFAERTQLKVKFERTGAPPSHKLPPDLLLAIFRVLQECLSNAVRHAGAAQVDVRLGFEAGRVLLAVNDDGRGFDPRVSKPGHYGLSNMKERAMKLGGELVIESRSGQGTRILLSLPL